MSIKSLFRLVLIVLFLSFPVFCMASPAFKVTIGSDFVVKACDVGLTSFDNKSKLYLAYGRKYILIPAVLSSDNAELSGKWTKKIESGIYSLKVETDDEKGGKELLHVTDYFAVVSPRIHQVSSVNSVGGDVFTVSGEFFTRKCQVYIGMDLDTMKKCRLVTTRSDIMDPSTGRSAVDVVVPRGIRSVNGAVVAVKSPVGEDLETIDSDLAAGDALAYVLSVGDIHETSKYMSTLTDFIKNFKKTHKGTSLAVSAGDFLTAYPRRSFEPEWARDLYTSDSTVHGVEMFKLLAKVPFDAVNLGNHDPYLSFSRLVELYKTYPQPVSASNIYLYQNSGYIPWYLTTSGVAVEPRITVKLKGFDVGIVLAGSTHQDHWYRSDKDIYKVPNVLDERTVCNIRQSSLLHDIVVLVTHQSDLSAIIPVYGDDPQPVGEYISESDIYSLIDLDNLALIVGGHEHKNIFRRASYTGDNETYALYVDKVYNSSSKAVLVKSSKFFGEYVGVVKIAWDKQSRSLEQIKLIEGKRGEDGKYLGCEENYLIEVDDDGMIQELDEDPWDPTVSSYWWKMDDWVIKK